MTIEEIKQQAADSIITDHNTAQQTMTQHFGSSAVKVVTYFRLRFIRYFIDGTLIYSVRNPTELQLQELQAAAFLYHTYYIAKSN